MTPYIYKLLMMQASPMVIKIRIMVDTEEVEHRLKRNTGNWKSGG